jgi:hypothetical protein
MFFLLFSATSPGQGRPEWYQVITYVLEEVAFLSAGLLCLRNWRSSQIVSGRTVWLAFGLGMLSYFIGNLFFAYWELGLKKEPDVTPADFFFILTYLLLGWGMFMAVLSRRLSLSLLQWLAVIGVGAVGSALAYAINLAPEEESTGTAAAPVEVLIEVPVAPGWATAIEEQLAPLSGILQLLYIGGDILLLVMAMALLLAFWGGRFALSWRCIAAASLSFYVADLWFNYATSFILDYETGALPEVFWIFSGMLFAIGAALEYDLSTRSRRGGRRRG